MMEFYGIGSIVSTAAILLYYAHTRNYHFFTTLVSCSQSSIALLFLLNTIVAVSYSLGSRLIKLVFGELRLVESENVYEKFWFTVMDTGLAMSIFRNELDSKFLLIFGLVLFLKVFHWILSYRIDYMEQNLNINWDFYTRMVSAWFVLLGVDLIFLTLNYFSYREKGPDMMLVFSLEVAMMVSLLVVIGWKFMLNVLETRSEEVWDDKGQWIFYMELAAVKLIIYALFFAIIILNYGLPIHMIRELYHTLSNFTLKIRDLIQYRIAVQNLKTKYPNASLQELEQTDKVCIICREEMEVTQGEEVQRTTPKKLDCGHIFHFKCLKSWLERQQSCPTCRTSLIQANQPPAADRPYMPRPDNQNDQNQAAQPEAARQNPQNQDFNRIPRFSSMNNLLKSLQDIAEKQGISMDRFRIRPVAVPAPGVSTDQAQSSSKDALKSNGNMSQTSSRIDLQDISQLNDWNFDLSSNIDGSLLEKLDRLKHLHQQLAYSIADIENDIRAMDRHLPKIDKGKQKV